ncbi:hypothetical protein HDU67_005183, partial [Dinochytrium kinnereticum]
MLSRAEEAVYGFSLDSAAGLSNSTHPAGLTPKLTANIVVHDGDEASRRKDYEEGRDSGSISLSDSMARSIGSESCTSCCSCSLFEQGSISSLTLDGMNLERGDSRSGSCSLCRREGSTMSRSSTPTLAWSLPDADDRHHRHHQRPRPPHTDEDPMTLHGTSAADLSATVPGASVTRTLSNGSDRGLARTLTNVSDHLRTLNTSFSTETLDQASRFGASPPLPRPSFSPPPQHHHVLHLPHIGSNGFTRLRVPASLNIFQTSVPSSTVQFSPTGATPRVSLFHPPRPVGHARQRSDDTIATVLNGVNPGLGDAT